MLGKALWEKGQREAAGCFQRWGHFKADGKDRGAL